MNELRKITEVNTASPGEPKNIAGRVSLFRSQLNEINALWASVRQPQPPHEVKIYENDVRSHNDAINHLEFLAKQAFIDYCIDGQVVAIGYTESYPPSLSLIHPNEWAFLNIDFKDSSATTQKTNYKKIKFIGFSELTKSEIDVLRKAYKNQKKLPPEEPSENDRNTIVNYIFNGDVMGDSYNIGQVGAIGKFATANGNTFNQQNYNANLDIDLAELAAQLSTLRNEMRKVASAPEHDEALEAIAAAEKFAIEQNKASTIFNLKKAGKWALCIAEKVGISLAAKSIEHAINLKF